MAAVPLWVGGAGSPYNTMSLGPRPTSVPSGILNHETVWPSIVTVAGICNSVGGGVLIDIPPRCQCQCLWRVQYAPCIAGQSSVPFPSPPYSSQRTRQPPPLLLIIRCSTTRRDRRGGRSRDRSPQSRRRWPRSTAHKSTSLVGPRTWTHVINDARSEAGATSEVRAA